MNASTIFRGDEMLELICVIADSGLGAPGSNPGWTRKFFWGSVAASN